MERLNSGDFKDYLRNNVINLIIGLMKNGRAQWQQENISILY